MPPLLLEMNSASPHAPKRLPYTGNSNTDTQVKNLEYVGSDPGDVLRIRRYVKHRSRALLYREYGIKTDVTTQGQPPTILVSSFNSNAHHTKESGGKFVNPLAFSGLFM